SQEHRMTTKRPRLDAETIAFRRTVFDIFAAAEHALGYVDHDEAVALTVEQYRHETGDKSARTRPSRIAALLADPARFSPFVDEVAVERALAFQWGVIESLSDLEWQTLIERLAAMPDPYDVQASRVPLYDVAEAAGLAGPRNSH